MTNFDISIEFQQLVKSEQAYHYRIIPVERADGFLTVETDTAIMIPGQLILFI